MTELVAAHGAEEFADSWLRAKKLDWAADCLPGMVDQPVIPPLTTPENQT
jgi:hypothetical protein